MLNKFFSLKFVLKHSIRTQNSDTMYSIRHPNKLKEVILRHNVQRAEYDFTRWPCPQNWCIRCDFILTYARNTKSLDQSQFSMKQDIWNTIHDTEEYTWSTKLIPLLIYGVKCIGARWLRLSERLIGSLG